MSYEKIAVGIYRHHHRYRAYAHGQSMYHTSERKARKWRKDQLAEVRSTGRPHRPYLHRVKRVDAYYDDLPVGICETVSTKILSDGTLGEYPTVTAYISDGGKIVATFSRTYGARRSRRSAIQEVEFLRDVFEKEYFG